MTISVDWPAGVITVPKADTVLTGTDPISGREIRSFDTDAFHENLRSEEETAAGRAWPITHFWNAEATLGGVTYAPQFIVVNNYQVEFENGSYRVVFTSTNNNIADFSVVNDVSIQPGNSAGLQIVTSGSGVTEQDKLDIADRVADRNYEGTYSLEDMMWILFAGDAGNVSGAPGGPIEIRDPSTGLTIRVRATVDANGNRTVTLIDPS